MKRRNDKGFTLVELLAVIVVLAIVMLVVADRVGDAMLKSRGNSLALQIKSISREVEKECAMNNEIKPDRVREIVESGNLTYAGYMKADNNITGTDSVTKLADDIVVVQAVKGSKFANIMETDDIKNLKKSVSKVTKASDGNTKLSAVVSGNTIGADAGTKAKNWLREPALYFHVSCPISGADTKLLDTNLTVNK